MNNNPSQWLDRILEIELIMGPLQTELSELRQKLTVSKSQFKVLDVIEWDNGSRRGVVIGIRQWVCGEPMWKVQRILKDGSRGSVCTVRKYMGPTLVEKSS